MINPAIETDLVGEIVRLDWRRYHGTQAAWATQAYGRVRAVVARSTGGADLWIEIIDEESQRLSTWHGDLNIGDVIVCAVGHDDDVRMAIIRRT